MEEKKEDAVSRYKKKNMVYKNVQLNKKIERDQEIIKFLETKDNFNGYIKDLILNDMKESNK